MQRFLIAVLALVALGLPSGLAVAQTCEGTSGTEPASGRGSEQLLGRDRAKRGGAGSGWAPRARPA